MSDTVDIPACEMLMAEIKTLKELPSPPDDMEEFAQFKSDINEKFNKAVSAVTEVKDYADKIMIKIQEIRGALNDYKTEIAKAIKDTLEKLRSNAAAASRPTSARTQPPGSGHSKVSDKTNSTPAPLPYEKGLLNIGKQLQTDGNATRGTNKSRSSKSKDKNLEALEKAHALEQMANELANNRLNDLTKETEKYLAKLQDGAQLTKTDIDELNGNCKAFVDKAKRSFEEQKIFEAEEKKRKELEEKKKKEQEEQEKLIREEQERMRLENEEKERKEKEEREKEEAEQRRRGDDPSCWSYFRYDCQTDEDSNCGINNGVCIFSSVDEKLTKDDTQCTMLDSTKVKNSLEPGETLASQLFCLRPKNGQLKFVVDARVFINHIASVNSINEACVKLSINSGPWKTFKPLELAKNIVITDGSLQFVGVTLNDFYEARLIVVVRLRGSCETIGREGGTICSDLNKKIQVHVPENAFDDETDVEISVKPTSTNMIDSIKNTLKERKLSFTNHVISIRTCKPTKDNLQVELPINPRENDPNFPVYRLISSSNPDQWTDANVVNGKDCKSVILPDGSDSYRVLDVTMPSRFTKDDATATADLIYDYANRTPVVLLFHQHIKDHKRSIIQCVEHARIEEAQNELAKDGFTYGALISPVFHLRDGQEIQIFFSGNIARDSNEEGLLKMMFLRNIHHTFQDVNIAVVNTFQQSGLPEYRGTLTCHVMEPGDIQSAERRTEYTVTLTITLPKPRVLKELPFYMRSLAVFLVYTLEGSDANRWDVIKAIVEGASYNILIRQANDIGLRKDDDRCTYVLYEWMKERAGILQSHNYDGGKLTSEEIIGVVIGNLAILGHRAIEKECVKYIRIQKDNLSNRHLANLISTWAGNLYTVGQNLGFSSRSVQQLIGNVPKDNHHRLMAVLTEWRVSQHAAKAGINVYGVLKTALGLG